MGRRERDFDRLWVIPAWIVGGLVAIALGLVVGFQIWAPGVVRQFDAVLAHTDNNTVVYDRADQPIATVEGVEDRHSVPISRISPYLQKAVVAVEDRRFFAHRGLDPVRLVGALWADIKAMAFEQGGSTITQQLVKLTLLSPERTLRRKAKELFLALAVEQAYPKLKVLEFYLNRVYLGFGMYGVEKASRAYFRKSAAELNLNEAAFLAALIRKPEGYLSSPAVEARADEPLLPVQQLEPLMQRQRYVIEVLRELGWISRAEYERALSEPLVVHRPRPEPVAAPYFVQQVLKRLREELGFQQVSGRGLQVYTTLDAEQQAAAEDIVSGVRERTPDAQQAALVALDPRSGAVRALVGGVDYHESQFNRATQALRQPGSAFKPILYATALENGFSTNAVFLDEPVQYMSDTSGSVVRLYEGDREPELRMAMSAEDDYSIYTPRNYNDRYGAVRGDAAAALVGDRRMTLARALELSSNVVAVQLLDRLGMNTLVRQAERWGVPVRPEAGLCVALGCSELTLLDLTAAYAAIANGGTRASPVYIRRVTNSQGDVLYRHYPEPPVEVLRPWTAFQMRHLLGNVMRRGTGVRARLDRPAGGKTGTNDGPRDTWFVGFTPRLVAGVWMGNDDNLVMPHETGGRTTATLWREFMTRALPPYQGQRFPEPPADYVGVNLCNVDGRPARQDCAVTGIHYFRVGEAPPGLVAGAPASGDPDDGRGGLTAPPAPEEPPATREAPPRTAAPPGPERLPGFSLFARQGRAPAPPAESPPPLPELPPQARPESAPATPLPEPPE